jgi:hypothetical protein
MGWGLRLTDSGKIGMTRRFMILYRVVDSSKSHDGGDGDDVA